MPHVILLIEGRVIHYKDAQISSAKILEFVRRKFPYRLVDYVNDGNVDLFLDGWIDNRVRGMTHREIGYPKNPRFGFWNWPIMEKWVFKRQPERICFIFCQILLEVFSKKWSGALKEALRNFEKSSNM